MPSAPWILAKLLYKSASIICKKWLLPANRFAATFCPNCIYSTLLVIHL